MEVLGIEFSPGKEHCVTVKLPAISCELPAESGRIFSTPAVDRLFFQVQKEEQDSEKDESCQQKTNK